MVTSSDGIATGSCPITFTRTYTITDSCNRSSTATQTININDTTAPVVTGSLNASSVNGCSISDAPVAMTTVVALEAAGLTISDNCTSDSNLVVTSSDGIATGSCPITFTRTYTITDSCNRSSTATQTITVQDTTAPVITSLVESLDVTLECSNATGIASALALVPLATDACDTTPTINLVSDVTTPQSATCTNAYVRVRIWNFTDDCGNTSSNFIQTITVQDTTAPVITSLIGSLDATLECSDATAIAVALAQAPVATDNCTIIPTLNLVSDVTTPNATCANSYQRVRTWNFTDGCGNTSSNFVQIININDTTAPVVTTVAASLDATLECSNATAIAAALAQAPVATDNCSVSPVIHLISDITTVSSVCANTYIRTRTWNFTDACGNLSSDFTQIITIQDDTKPTFTGQLPQNLNLECHQNVPNAAILNATDNCNGIVTIDFEEETVPGSCPSNSTILRTWTATDICGNFETHSQVITIEDNTPPTFDQDIRNPELYAKCDAIPAPQELNAFDLCGAATVRYEEVTVEGDCTNKYRLDRTWTATDLCGNFSTTTQTVYLACEIEVFNAVSPDGDGLNDSFIIEGLECYPKNSVEIYNRWGILVYKTSSYDNETNVFKGYSDDRVTVSRSDKLPTGTYWYILRYEYDLYGTAQENIQKIGYLYIQNE